MKLPDFKLERYFAKYEFNAPHLLCCSDCESFTIKEILSLEGESGKPLPISIPRFPQKMSWSLPGRRKPSFCL